jgi:hypothetical protein
LWSSKTRRGRLLKTLTVPRGRFLKALIAPRGAAMCTTAREFPDLRLIHRNRRYG